MNKRSFPMIAACCVLALAALAGYLLPEPSEANPTRLLLENSGGRVVFTHKEHSSPGEKYGDLSCNACHHELNMDGTDKAAPPSVRPCKSCHGTADAADFTEEHQKRYRAKGGDASCASCHHTRMSGFAKGWNHEDHKGYAGDCESCHHPKEYKKPSGETVNIEPQKCSNCHTSKPGKDMPVTLKDAGHARCVTCHEEWFGDKLKGCASCHEFKPAGGEAKLEGKSLVACASCHGPLSSSMDAFHGQCMTCHDKKGRGPGVKAPCAQCHTP